MIRQPTLRTRLYRWHRNALAGLRQPVIEDEPQCGWYARAYVRNGPLVPARIWLHQVIDPETGELAEDERLMCAVGDAERNPVWEWPKLARRPITRLQFEDMRELHATAAALAATHAPLNLAHLTREVFAR